MDFLRNLLNVGRAGAHGVLAYQQQNVENEQAKEEREAEQRRRVLEEAILQLQVDTARKPPEQTYDVTVDGMRGTFRTPEEARAFRDKHRIPEPQERPEPRAPIVRELPDGRSVQWNYATSQWEPMMVGGRPVAAPPPGAGGGTVAERQNARLGIVASRANAELDQLDTHMVGIPEAVLAGGGGTTGIFSGVRNLAMAKLAGEEGQRATTAALNFINPVVRYLSGAQMNEGEAARYFRALIPQPGESQETVEMKRRMRQIIIEAMGTGQWEAPPSDTPNIANLEAALAEAQALAQQQAQQFGPMAGGYRVAPHPENPYR